jgi:hypothetical protein
MHEHSLAVDPVRQGLHCSPGMLQLPRIDDGFRAENVGFTFRQTVSTIEKADSMLARTVRLNQV